MLDEKAVSSGNMTRDVLKQMIKELLAEAGIEAPIAANPPPSSANFEQQHPLDLLPNAKAEADVASAEVVPGVGLVYRMLLLLQVREHAGVLSKADD
ncbi:hypothetical protein PF002_g27727 [Phytophthora fragariae]|uniref:Uncharacterized protein n=1 Tax=Phytophthora fragariae TaxID=53985 RepID=A0A6A3WH54_9STRA|nr:hypothetical protein PF002_g27727 [Phytophthora fragariae]